MSRPHAIRAKTSSTKRGVITNFVTHSIPSRRYKLIRDSESSCNGFTSSMKTPSFARSEIESGNPENTGERTDFIVRPGLGSAPRFFLLESVT